MAKKKVHILFVEDHPDTLRLYQRVLDLEGYSTRGADNFKAAVSLAEQEPFDLLICDISLPDGSGWELLERLRQEMPGLPGIVITGHGFARDIARSARAGFCVHLTKPIETQKLLDSIRRCLASAERAIETTT